MKETDMPQPCISSPGQVDITRLRLAARRYYQWAEGRSGLIEAGRAAAIICLLYDAFEYGEDRINVVFNAIG